MHRSGLLGAVRMVKLPSDKNFSLRGDTLQAALDKDKAAGLIPFFVSLTERPIYAYMYTNAKL